MLPHIRHIINLLFAFLYFYKNLRDIKNPLLATNINEGLIQDPNHDVASQ